MPWIGAQVTFKKQNGKWSTLTELMPAKVKDMQGNVDKLFKAKGMVDIQQGAAPCRAVEVFQQHSARDRAALPEVVQEGRPGQPFSVERIRQALAWVRLLVRGLIATRERKLSFQRWTDVSTRSATMRIVLHTDASPHGFGAILFVQSVPKMWLADDWEKEDFNLFGAERGDPAWQSELELHAVLLAIDTWLPRLRGQSLCLFLSDSTAALYAVMQTSSETQAMNALAAEIALRLECANVFTVPEHVAGKLNFDCDAVSRLSEGAQLPAILGNVRRDVPKPRQPRFFWDGLLRCL